MFSSQSVDMFFYSLVFNCGFTIHKKNIIILLFLSLNDKNKRAIKKISNICIHKKLSFGMLFLVLRGTFCGGTFFKGHLVDS